ncbi:MAG: Phosphodiester glycosidase, partial [Actinomycetota bacterium]
ATYLLRTLGVTDAINLDGGVSTTFFMACDIGACFANRPSDGHERPVAVALAIVPTKHSGVLRAAAVGNATPTVDDVAPAAPAPSAVAPAVAPPPVAQQRAVHSTTVTTFVAAPPLVSRRASPPSPHAPVAATHPAPSRTPATAAAAMAIAAWSALYALGRRRLRVPVSRSTA